MTTTTWVVVGVAMWLYLFGAANFVGMIWATYISDRVEREGGIDPLTWVGSCIAAASWPVTTPVLLWYAMHDARHTTRRGKGAGDARETHVPVHIALMRDIDNDGHTGQERPVDPRMN